MFSGKFSKLSGSCLQLVLRIPPILYLTSLTGGRMNGRMDGWVDGWVGGWMDEIELEAEGDPCIIQTIASQIVLVT